MKPGEVPKIAFHGLPATARVSWWIGRTREMFQRKAAKQLKRMKRSTHARPTITIIGHEGIWNRRRV